MDGENLKNYRNRLDNIIMKMNNRSKNNIFYFIIFLLLFVQCTNKSNSHITLTGENIDSDTIFMRFPYRIEICDSFLVLFDLVPDKYIYHIYSYPNINYLHSIGIRGSSPDEITLSTPFQITNNKLFILDGARGNLFKYDIKHASILSKTNYKINLTVDFINLNDTTIITGDMSGVNRLIEVTPSSQEALFSIPKIDKQEENPGNLWRSFMSYNPNLNKIAMATQSGDVIEVYDIKTQEQYICIGKDGIPRSASQIEGYHDIKWVNNEIYALFSGRSRAELNRMFEAGKRMPDGGNIIKIFDEKGVYIRSLLLDQYINGFTYDKINNRILGITSNSDNPIFIFDLNVIDRGIDIADIH